MGRIRQLTTAVQGQANVSATLKVGTELWATWADIAIESTAVARAARERAAEALDAGEQPDWNEELRTAMVAIAAVASSIDGFAAVVQETGVAVAAPTVAQPTRAHWIWETLRAGFDVSRKTNTWPRDLKDLWVLRSGRGSGGLLPRTILGAPADYPLIPNVTKARATYTVETAGRALALMQDIYATCKDAVRPGNEQLIPSRISGLHGTLTRLSTSD